MIARWRRASRHLRFRVTAAATVAAVGLAIAGALLFVTLFQRSLLAGTDTALRTITGQIAADLQNNPATPSLAPVTGSTRTTVLQLFDPSGALHQTVTTSSGLGRTSRDGRTTLISPAELAAGRAGTSSFTHGHAQVVLTPVIRSDGTWVLLAAADLEQVEDAARDAQVTFEIAVPILVVLIAVGAWLLSGAVLRPVERIRADAAGLRRRVAAGSDSGLGRVHEPDSGDEIQSLAKTLNGLLADLSGAADRQRDLVADAGHELRTPLSVLRMELELADRPGREPAYLREAVGHARGEVERLTALAEDLLLLADAERRVVRDARTADVGEIVQEAVRAHRALATQREIELHADVGVGASAVVDGASLRRVVDNLLGNALGMARSDVGVAVTTVGHDVSVTVTDDGPGFDPGFLPHAFDRFTRADDARRRTGAGGAGLGLAIVAAVAAAHGGRAEAANTATGARVAVLVPRA